MSLMQKSPGGLRRAVTEDLRCSKRELSTAAVLANGFVNERIEFAAGQCDILIRSLAIVAGDGQFGAAAGWRCDEIARARGHELRDFAARKQRGFAGHLRCQRNFRTVLDGLHSKEGGEKIRAAGYGTVVGQEQGVVVRDEGFDRRA